ncbi:hypothetical protein AB0M36_32975 [Actinoplanes sp. NPDC051346]|uniref:hypothetical protein n=1 Tax=Actinoplanes sp. NPDC051346 TaxID=3155048 RepID=UPI00342A84D9
MKRKPIAITAVVVLVAALGLFFVSKSFTGGLKLPRLGPECTVRADGEVTLDSVQMANAATISAVGMRRKMPERAVVVALATAFQESKLENLDTGDRDSVGLFQQRPSQGWGTPEKIQDPRYAADKFYSALKKVKGWKKMRVTDAAQKVQRSAYPNAYEKWADESEVLAKALTGRATGAVECAVSGKPTLRGAAAATALAQGFALDWGVEAPNAADLTVAVKDPSAGWQYAHWLVSHAESTGLERVRFADREWTAPDGKWQPVTGDRRVGNGTVVAEVFH